MPTFEYKAKTQAGELVAGTLAAGDRRLALAQLGRLGYFPLAVDVAKAERPAKREWSFRRSRVSNRDTLMFTRQLATLLRAGMSLSDALTALIRRTQHPALVAVITQLQADIIQGESLSGALAKHPQLFNRFYINLTRAGEASGYRLLP